MENIKENTNMVKRKMKLNIKGRFKTFWTRLFLKNKLKAIGVDVHAMNDAHPQKTELTVYGTKDNLWDVVRWSKTQNLFIELQEVVFEFVD